MPPPFRNHRDPTGPETPHAIAASPLLKPSATLSQNARSTSRRAGGLPGDRIAGRPVLVVIHPAGRPINTPLLIGVLRRPPESAQYLAIRYTQRLAEAGAVASVGSRGDSYDNALAEAFHSLFKAELVRHRGPWRNIDDLEIAVAEYIDWYNHRRLHGEIGLVPPAQYDHTHYRHNPPPTPGGPAAQSLH